MTKATEQSLDGLEIIDKDNHRLTSTLHAAALCKMADWDQITGGLIGGPLDFDNWSLLAISAAMGAMRSICCWGRGSTPLG